MAKSYYENETIDAKFGPYLTDFLRRDQPGKYYGIIHDSGDWVELIGNNGTPRTAPSTKDWKFHLSVHPDDVPKAWEIVTPILIKNNVEEAKVAIPELAQKFHNPLNSQSGKQIVVYGFGDVSAADQMREIEIALRSNDIRPSALVQGDKLVPGSLYAGYRNDQDEGYVNSRGQQKSRYVSAEAVQGMIKSGKVAPDMAHNPYNKPDSLQHIDFSNDAGVQAAGRPGEPIMAPKGAPAVVITEDAPGRARAQTVQVYQFDEAGKPTPAAFEGLPRSSSHPVAAPNINEVAMRQTYAFDENGRPMAIGGSPQSAPHPVAAPLVNDVMSPHTFLKAVDEGNFKSSRVIENGDRIETWETQRGRFSNAELVQMQETLQRNNVHADIVKGNIFSGFHDKLVAWTGGPTGEGMEGFSVINKALASDAGPSAQVYRDTGNRGLPPEAFEEAVEKVKLDQMRAKNAASDLRSARPNVEPASSETASAPKPAKAPVVNEWIEGPNGMPVRADGTYTGPIIKPAARPEIEVPAKPVIPEDVTKPAAQPAGESVEPRGGRQRGKGLVYVSPDGEKVKVNPENMSEFYGKEGHFQTPSGRMIPVPSTPPESEVPQPRPEPRVALASEAGGAQAPREVVNLVHVGADGKKIKVTPENMDELRGKEGHFRTPSGRMIPVGPEASETQAPQPQPEAAPKPSKAPVVNEWINGPDGMPVRADGVSTGPVIKPAGSGTEPQPEGHFKLGVHGSSGVQALEHGASAFNLGMGGYGVYTNIRDGNVAGTAVSSATFLSGAVTTTEQYAPGMIVKYGGNVGKSLVSVAEKADVPLMVAQSAYDVFSTKGNFIDTNADGSHSLGNKGDAAIKAGLVGGGSVLLGAAGVAGLPATVVVVGSSMIIDSGIEANHSLRSLKSDIIADSVAGKVDSAHLGLNRNSAPSVRDYRHLYGDATVSQMMAQSHFDAKTEAGLHRRADGQFDASLLDMSDSKNLAEYRRVLQSEAAKESAIVKASDSWVPDLAHQFGHNLVGASGQGAVFDRIDAQKKLGVANAALSELGQYEQDLAKFKKDNPNLSQQQVAALVNANVQANDHKTFVEGIEKINQDGTDGLHKLQKQDWQHYGQYTDEKTGEQNTIAKRVIGDDKVRFTEMNFKAQNGDHAEHDYVVKEVKVDGQWKAENAFRITADGKAQVLGRSVADDRWITGDRNADNWLNPNYNTFAAEHAERDKANAKNIADHEHVATGALQDLQKQDWHQFGKIAGENGSDHTYAKRETGDDKVRFTELNFKAEKGDHAENDYIVKQVKIDGKWQTESAYQLTKDGQVKLMGTGQDGNWHTGYKIADGWLNGSYNPKFQNADPTQPHPEAAAAPHGHPTPHGQGGQPQETPHTAPHPHEALAPLGETEVKNLQKSFGLADGFVNGKFDENTKASIIAPTIIQAQATKEYQAWAKDQEAHGHHFAKDAHGIYGDGIYGEGTKIGMQALVKSGQMTQDQYNAFNALGGEHQDARVAAQRMAAGGYHHPDAQTAQQYVGATIAAGKETPAVVVNATDADKAPKISEPSAAPKPLQAPTTAPKAAPDTSAAPILTNYANNYLIPDSHGKVSVSAPGVFPAFGQGYGEYQGRGTAGHPPNVSMQQDSIQTWIQQGQQRQAMLAEYKGRSEAAVAQKQEQVKAEKAHLTRAELIKYSRQKLYAEQKNNHFADGGAESLKQANRKLGLSDSHRGRH